MVLDKINNANDIKKLESEDYPKLAEEIRKYIIDTVSKTGGHLSSSLGVVELTMALHLCLNLPEDKILWDVGHQAYAHKILTGRKDAFATLRMNDGISGFPSRDESEYDAFGMGHASTSLSAALGFVSARELSGGNNTVVAVIGDGALTGGLALEALNNAAQIKSNLIIILNDNEMSISKNVGGISRLLTDVRMGNAYNDIKDSVKNNLSKIPGYGEELIGKIHRTKNSIKQLFVPGNFFEDMGISYLGPVEGYDLSKLIRIINMAKRVNHAVLIHVHTKKGKGCGYAEKKPSLYHGVEPFNKGNGVILGENSERTYSDVFSSFMLKAAENDEKVVGITAAMSDGTGLRRFEKKYPDRFFDVGIAEEHAVTFAAGLAAESYKPYTAIYSTFLQRSFDQIIHDVCIQRLPVKFIVERAGIVGKDGITHQGIFDLSYLGIIPGMTIMAPKNRLELRDMLEYTLGFDAPVAIRFPKGKASEVYQDNMKPIEYGVSEVLKKGSRIAVIAAGSGVEIAAEVEDRLADEGFDPEIINARFVKPIDKAMIDRLAADFEIIATIEENVFTGGFGMSVTGYINSKGYDVKVYNAALPDEYIEHGDCDTLKDKYGLNSETITNEIIRRLNK